MAEWTVDASDECIATLAKSFQHGPVMDDGRRLLEEQFVGHIQGLKVEIFSDEHPPPHFRVKYAGETANYAIRDCRQLNGGLKRWYRTVKDWHSENKQALIDTWNRTRPSDCPVGEYRE